ncbi:hypothetical protein FSARC_13026 [Fusarium sarcochroum]|uniref:IBR domain-containing protein n=1 Tax=Fusarium sarcochroum TaxID=1208366 RepID=A0A8H4WU71_9HYPO|nr:hypothetical protein FSARC_13026 [Fusarium sarcochroum]
MRLGYDRDVGDGEARLVRRRPLRPESHDWYGPSDVVPYYPMPHRTRIDELQRPNGRTPRGYSKGSRSLSLDAYPPTMPPAHLMRASTDAYKKRPQFSVYEADDDDEEDERWPPMKPRGRHPEPARPRQVLRRPREPTPESTPPTESSEESESDSDEESDDNDQIEVVVEEPEEDKHRRHHHHHHRHRRHPSPDDYLSSPDEKRAPRRRNRMPSPSTSDEMEIRYRQASSERGSPDRRPALRREISDTPRYSLPTRFNSVLGARPPVASRRAAKVIESREIIREGRPLRLATVETVQVSRDSSRRPPSIAASGFASSRNTSPDRPRIMRFKQSLSDPGQMPPTCCTDDHIGLEHVDKLFDPTFKKIWNKKFIEYSLKGRLYCPSRRCGEWIRPADIYRDRDTGRKAARCDRCNTKVCVTCNGRWHFSSKCPRDEETARFLEYARLEGQKRCYRCGASAQLREGDNHALCRCGAEFCVVCGEKPKRCECPWFDPDAPDSDHHEQAITHRGEITVFREDSTTGESRIARRPRGSKQARPQIYDEEAIIRQQEEEHEDELPRRPRYYDKDNEYDVVGAPEVPRGGDPPGHYANDSPRRVVRRVVGAPPSPSRPEFERGPPGGRGGYYGGHMDRRAAERRAEERYAPHEMDPPSGMLPPGLRPPPMGMPPPVLEEGYHGGGIGPLIVERDPNNYDDDDSYYSHSSRSRKGLRRSDTLKSSELAGLSGRSSGMGRIDVWRNFVEPGDPEGELAAAAASA